MTSPWCRCIETARLAFGPAELSSALGNLFGGPELQAKQVGEMEVLVGGWAGRGNLVLVSHGSTIAALTGTNPSPAEMVLATPRGQRRFEVRGRLTAHQP